MLLEEFVEGARLRNRDLGAQSELLIKKLCAETPETIGFGTGPVDRPR
jgi:hypothetical protein